MAAAADKSKVLRNFIDEARATTNAIKLAKLDAKIDELTREIHRERGWKRCPKCDKEHRQRQRSIREATKRTKES